MAEQFSISNNRLISAVHRHRGVMVPAAAMALIMVLLIPLPPRLLDVLLIFSLTLSAVILLTTLGNGLLNGMLAPLLGLNLTFRQSLAVVLMSFAVVSVMLGALSPVAWFVVWNTPPLTAAMRLSSPEYGVMQLTLAGFIALAGVVGNAHLLPFLREWAHSASTARHVLFAWLAGNLFLGSQICWVLRPFIWDPARPVEFIGREYFHGSFYETVFEAVRRLIFS